MITLTYGVIANLSFGQIEKHLRLRRHQRHRAAVDHRHDRPAPAPALLPHARDRAAALPARPLPHAHAVRHRAAGRARRAGAHELAGLQRRAAPHARVQRSARSWRRSRACCSCGGTATSIRRRSACGATINMLIIAVIGGLRRIEGAFVGALAFVVHQRPPGRDRLLDRGLQARHVQLADRARLPRHRAASRPTACSASGSAPRPARSAARHRAAAAAGD